MYTQTACSTADRRTTVLFPGREEESAQGGFIQRLAEIRQSWSPSERARRALLGAVRKQKLLSVVAMAQHRNLESA